jgi:hypothetical protein
VLQEMLGLKGVAGGAVATLVTLAAPAVYLWNSEPGSFRTFWIFRRRRSGRKWRGS